MRIKCASENRLSKGEFNAHCIRSHYEPESDSRNELAITDITWPYSSTIALTHSQQAIGVLATSVVHLTAVAVLWRLCKAIMVLASTFSWFNGLGVASLLMNNNAIRFQSTSKPPLDVVWLNAHPMRITANAHSLVRSVNGANRIQFAFDAHPIRYFCVVWKGLKHKHVLDKEHLL